MARQARKQTAKPITAAQVKRIHTIVSSLRINDENYRAALEGRFNVTTCKALTLMQAKSFIAELEQVALQVDRERRQTQRDEAERTEEAAHPKRFSDLGNRPGMATPPQLRKIEGMWQDVSIIPDADARNRALRRFVQRIAGVADLRFLDREGTSKVINALNAMEKQLDKTGKGSTRRNDRTGDLPSQGTQSME